MCALLSTFADFWLFYREYAHTGAHAASTAALTALGLLTIVHRGFAVLAITAYVVPLVYTYLTADRDADRDEGIDTGAEPERSDASGGETRRASRDREERTRSQSVEPEIDESDAEPTSTEIEPSGDGTSEGETPAETSATEPSDDEGAKTESPDEMSEPREWEAVDAPTDGSLLDVAAAREDAYAAGADGGVLVRDDGWSVRVERGPSGDSNALRGIDAASDGGAVWVVGDSGAVGRFDVDADRMDDHSAPRDKTTTWEAVAVAGPAGEERVALGNGSGVVLAGTYDGGEVDWDAEVKPASGSSLSGLAFVSDAIGYVCDTNATVCETTDGGATYERIGIDRAPGALVDVAAVAAEEAIVAGADGDVFEYDGVGWRTRRVADSPLRGIDLRDDESVVCGDGAIYERREEWERAETPTDEPLFGVALLEEGAVAVGEGGTILERRG